MRMFKNSANELFSLKWLFLITAFVLFGWINRQIVVQNSVTHQVKINIWDIWLSQQMNATFLIYIFLPVVILSSVLSIQNNYTYPILVRTRSWFRWILFSFNSNIPNSLSILTYFVVTSWIMTTGSQLETVWSPFSMLPVTSFNWISSIGYESGLTPYWFLVLNVIQLLIFQILLHVFLSCCYVLFPHIYFLMGMGFLVFLYGALSLRYFPDTSLTLFRYMSVAASKFLYPSVYHAMILLLSLIFIIVVGTIYLNKTPIKLTISHLKGYFGYILYSFILLLGLLSPINSTNDQTIWDLVYSRFYGFDRNGEAVLSIMLYYFIVFIGFTYIQALLVNNILVNRFYYSLIRYKSYWRWFLAYVIRTWGITFIFISSITAVTILIGTLSGLSSLPTITFLPQVSVTHLLYHMLVNGWLQLVNYQLMVFVIFWISSRPSVRIGAVILIITISIPTLNNGWLPAGLNAMGYLTQSWKETLQITCVLTAWIILMLGCIGYLFRKKHWMFAL
ncbi:hypothetical protein [Paenibacillus amylolyticus]|uniref:hypothetical protein n=1 Tax=Paenibacillus amylolyticus TaxID=1451 RepID=UPI003EB87682